MVRRALCCHWHRVSLASAAPTPSLLRRYPVPETPQTDAPVLEAGAAEEELVEESLVEEVSIDGMCGVY